MHKKPLRVAHDVLSSSTALIATDCAYAQMRGLQGDFNHKSTDVPLVIKRILDTKLVDRVIVYSRHPRAFEIHKVDIASWDQVFPTVARLLSCELNDSSYSICDMADIDTHYGMLEACG